MTLFKNKYRNESLRLKNYDYSQPGEYFITICTKNRKCLFGEIENGEMVLNNAGKIAEQCWIDIPFHFPNVSLDAFVIMPNHVHGIIIINKKSVIVGTNDNSSLRLPVNNKFRSPSKTVGSIVRGFKIGVTKWFRQNTNVYDVWQSNYYEHIIRGNKELNRIRKYIINNPLNWVNDNNYLK